MKKEAERSASFFCSPLLNVRAHGARQRLARDELRDGGGDVRAAEERPVDCRVGEEE